MNDHDLTLALAICELLEKSVTPEAVEKAFEKAKKRVERYRNPQPARDAKISYGPHHE